MINTQDRSVSCLYNEIYSFFILQRIGGIIIKKELLKLKGENAVVCYIEMLQSNIARMSNHSGIIKASMCVIYTVISTLIMTIEKMKNYWWIALVITIFVATVDAYYLAIEKVFVDKYNTFISKLNSGSIDATEIYDMKPRMTTFKFEILARTLESMKSFSILGFYGIFIIISIIMMQEVQMSRNVFISFRYNDGILYKEKLSRIFDMSTNIINYSEREDRSMMSDEAIKAHLYRKLSRTSVTIVLITPNAIHHKKDAYGRIDDWIYDEIRYSLEDRENNKCNGLIAVYTPEAKNMLMTYNPDMDVYRINDVLNLFRKNMMNVLPQYKKNPIPNRYDSDYDSYCSLVSFDNFIKNPERYIAIAEEKRNNINRYRITKRIPVESIFFQIQFQIQFDIKAE